MKTAISIPDRLFEEAERVAEQRGMSRSELYTLAISEYLDANRSLGVRERLDAVYSVDPQSSALEPEVAALQEKSLGSDR